MKIKTDPKHSIRGWWMAAVAPEMMAAAGGAAGAASGAAGATAGGGAATGMLGSMIGGSGGKQDKSSTVAQPTPWPQTQQLQQAPSLSGMLQQQQQVPQKFPDYFDANNQDAMTQFLMMGL